MRRAVVFVRENGTEQRTKIQVRWSRCNSNVFGATHSLDRSTGCRNIRHFHVFEKIGQKDRETQPCTAQAVIGLGLREHVIVQKRRSGRRVNAPTRSTLHC